MCRPHCAPRRRRALALCGLVLPLLLAAPPGAAGGVPTKFAPEGSKVASLTVEAASGQAASLVLLSKDQPAYTLQADKSGTFSVRQGDADIITISETGDLVARTHMLAAGALSAGTGVYVRDTMQWALVADEEFSAGQSGWSKAAGGGAGDGGGKVPTSQCRGGLYLLGGFEGLAQEAVRKTFAGLPPHTKVRVAATFHFIDDWNGETAYMKVGAGGGGGNGGKGLEYAWTERYDVADYRGTIDVCGAALGEGRFAAPIDVSMAHTGDKLQVEFGSTLNLPAAAAKGFYGVSSVQVYVRS